MQDGQVRIGRMFIIETRDASRSGTDQRLAACPAPGAMDGRPAHEQRLMGR
ncbi:hypothetical protein [Roseiflexus sp.]